MKRLAILFAVVAFPLLAFGAGGKLFTWNAPTERVDNSPLPNSEIDSYRIYCDGDSTPIWTQSNSPAFDERWQAPDGTFAVGTHTCHATTVDTLGQESGPSNTLNFIVNPDRPKPPILAVQ